jgi:putative addiction module killer protein
VETREKQVEYYFMANGRVPFREWYESLRDRGAQLRIDARLAHVRAGNSGKCRTVGEGVTELILDFGPGYRIYYGQVGNAIVILLCGGDKSTQQEDIATAHEYWVDYRRRDA